MRCASSGSPGETYWIRESCAGKPEKSWIVSGARDAVTRIGEGASKWADTTTTARGFGIDAANSLSAPPQGLFSIAIIGEPCETKSAGSLPFTASSKGPKLEETVRDSEGSGSGALLRHVHEIREPRVAPTNAGPPPLGVGLATLE